MTMGIQIAVGRTDGWIDRQAKVIGQDQRPFPANNGRGRAYFENNGDGPKQPLIH